MRELCRAARSDASCLGSVAVDPLQDFYDLLRIGIAPARLPADRRTEPRYASLSEERIAGSFIHEIEMASVSGEDRRHATCHAFHGHEIGAALAAVRKKRRVHLAKDGWQVRVGHRSKIDE